MKSDKESNLAVKQPRRAPHNVLQATTSEGHITHKISWGVVALRWCSVP